jgi:hypothetical protein
VVLAHAVRALEQWIGGDPAVADADRGVQIASHWDRRLLAQALSTQALVDQVGQLPGLPVDVIESNRAAMWGRARRTGASR